MAFKAGLPTLNYKGVLVCMSVLCLMKQMTATLNSAFVAMARYSNNFTKGNASVLPAHAIPSKERYLFHVPWHVET